MTLVKMAVQRPAGEGLTSSAGQVEWRPTKRRTAGPAVVMPAPFWVELTKGFIENGAGVLVPAGVAVVDVAPTGPDWCWTVDERVAAGAERTVAVPDVPEIAYTALMDVDPTTLEPSAAPDPGWYAYTDGLALSAEAARGAAVGAQAAAGLSATAAGVSADDAAAAREAAERAETGAGAAATAAALSAADAQAKADTATAEAIAAKYAAQQSADSSAAAQLFVEHLAVTANPADPDVVTLHFPSWRYAPGDTDALQLTIGVEVP